MNEVSSLPEDHQASAFNEGFTKAGSYHLRVKVGIAEFDCAGPAELVREDYQAFLDLINTVGAKAIGSRQLVASERDRLEEKEVDEEEVESNSIEVKTWDRVFLRKEDRLSLNMLPDSKHQNSDSILMLIYGYQTLMGLDGVTSISLLDAAKQSGLRVDRIDRNLTAEHTRLLLKGGTGKGTRYSLNNRGMSYVQNLLEGMFE